MNKPGIIERIHGIIPAVPTPFTTEEDVDVPALRRIVQFLLDGGVHGLWVLGTGSEFAALAEGQKRCVVSTVVEEAKGRVPVLAGTGEGGTALAVRTAKLAAQCGADALFAIPPYYYFYEEREVLSHLITVAGATRLPVIVYNNPFNTKNGISIEVVRSLCREPGFIGIKDSSLNFDAFQDLLRAVPRDGSFKVLQGDEMSLAASLIFGADGAVLALPTLAPRLCVELYNCARMGDTVRAQALQAEAADLFTLFQLRGRSGDSAFLAGQKAALELLGLCSRNVSRPFRAFSDEELEPVKQVLQRHHLLAEPVPIRAT